MTNSNSPRDARVNGALAAKHRHQSEEKPVRAATGGAQSSGMTTMKMGSVEGGQIVRSKMIARGFTAHSAAAHSQGSRWVRGMLRSTNATKANSAAMLRTCTAWANPTGVSGRATSPSRMKIQTLMPGLGPPTLMVMPTGRPRPAMKHGHHVVEKKCWSVLNSIAPGSNRRNAAPATRATAITRRHLDRAAQGATRTSVIAGCAGNDFFGQRQISVTTVPSQCHASCGPTMRNPKPGWC